MARIEARITLGRQPHTDGAKAFVGAVLDHIRATLAKGEKRAIGPKSLPKWRQDLGNVLAGVMRPSEGAARVAKGKASPMWAKETGSLQIDRCWRIADALVAAGLLGFAPGLRGKDTGSGNSGTPALLWTLPALWDLAAAHGVTPATRKDDWRLPDAPATPAKPRGVLVRPWPGVPLGLTAGMEDERERLARQLQAINDYNASVVIRGAGETVTLFRSFRHSLHFGGRFYGPAYMNVSEGERAAITFDGEPCVEIDVGSAQLSLACGLAGAVGPLGELPRDDLYVLPDIPRAAAKAWSVRTFGRGTAQWPKHAWIPKDGPEIKAVSVRDVKAAMLGAYPFLGDLPALVPPGVLDGVPEGKRCLAAGQWITRREADTIGDAMGRCVAQGVPVLPVHDALIVPRGAAEIARAALAGAYMDGPGVAVRLKG